MASAPVSRSTKPWRRLQKIGLALSSVLSLGLALTFASVNSAYALQAVGSSSVSAVTARATGMPQPTPSFAIRIVPGSDIHLVAKSSKLPISIRNDYNAEIRVQVHVAPSNLRALVPASIEVTVPAQTTYVAQVPVTAIADGSVPLKAWLTTFSGLPLGNSVNLNLSVNAEVESSVIAGFGIIVAGLGIAGVLRTRAKRRKLKLEQG